MARATTGKESVTRAVVELEGELGRAVTASEVVNHLLEKEPGLRRRTVSQRIKYAAESDPPWLAKEAAGAIYLYSSTEHGRAQLSGDPA